MASLEHIDDYFTNRLSGEMKQAFENKIALDPSFAEDVAFYLSVKNIAETDARKLTKERFKGLYDQQKPAATTVQPSTIIRRLLPWVAAAAVVAVLVIGWIVFNVSTSPGKLADQYVKENFQTLSVTMSTKTDSLQTGINLCNEGKPGEALAQFESMINRDPSSSEAIKYAGIAALQSGDYTKAVKYFEVLENWPGLRVNLGKFYHALTLMKRGQPNDMKTAKELLKEIDQKNLDGKTQARVWLGKF